MSGVRRKLRAGPPLCPIGPEHPAGVAFWLYAHSEARTARQASPRGDRAGQQGAGGDEPSSVELTSVISPPGTTVPLTGGGAHTRTGRPPDWARQARFCGGERRVDTC